MKNWKFMAFGIGLACVGFFAHPSTSEAQKKGGGGGGRAVAPAPARVSASPARPTTGKVGNGTVVNNNYYGNRSGYGSGYGGFGYGGYGYGNGLGLGVGGLYLGRGGYNNGYGYNNGFGYNNPGFAYSAPSYNSVGPSIVYGDSGVPSTVNQSFYPSDVSGFSPSNDSGRGTIVVTVPSNADVLWGGSRSTLTGPTRMFSTLPLDANGAMQSFEARWTGPDGQAVTRTREIRAMPNTTVVIDFTKATGDGKN